ncbi:MAG: protein kinase [Polyangiaceae bacterium]
MGLQKFGRYEALHRIASGGMATVYLGRTRGAGGFERLVALKVMHEHIAHDPTFSAMFLDEARLAAGIRHPNVVPTLDVASDGRYLVLEYVEGASLHAVLTRLRKAGERLPLDVALRIFVDALSGLHAAHELTDRKGNPLNIVHRDVSPHNILVGVDGTSRITDFGIAYAEARITSTRGGELKGKLPYMAPEQLEDATVDRRTDVYAAGCVLWEMLVGRRLFRGKSEAAIACAVLAGPTESPREAGVEVPESIDAACMQALAPVGHRFVTALAFSEALERAADQAGIRIARHRDVGPVAKQTALTFPALSEIISSGEPAEIDQLAPTVPEPSPIEPSPISPTLTGVPSTVTATAVPARPTLVSEAPSSKPASAPPPPQRAPGDATLVTPVAPRPPHAATTVNDRPTPEVAAIIRAAQGEAAPGDVELSVGDEAPDTQMALSLPRRSGSNIAILAGAAGVGVALGLWVFLVRAPAEPETEAPTVASAVSKDGPQVSARPAAPTTSAAPHEESPEPSPSSAPSPTAEPGAEASSTPAPPPPAPPPLPRPGIAPPPAPVPTPAPTPKTTLPPPSATGYHPAAP